MRKIFVTGIGTDVGKTVVCAILCEALQADYWKPIQCGVDDKTAKTDSQIVKELVSNSKTKIHVEQYCFKNAMSPHVAAKLEVVEINIDTIKIPETNNTLIIEGAGGLMVPLNEKHLVVDLIENLNAEVIIVSQSYLGSINHTSLTCSELKRRNINVIGIVFNGKSNEESEKIILNFSGLKCIGYINEETTFTKEVVKVYSNKLLSNFQLSTFN